MFRQLIKDYFSFTQKERIAIITLILLIVSVYLVPNFIKPSSSKISEHEIKEFKLLQQQIVKARDSKKNYQYQANYDEEEGEHAIAYSPPLSINEHNDAGQLFYFDPNNLSARGWKQLGLRDKTISTIQKYLARGGHFYKATDLKKIYGLHPNEYERILPYIRISNHSSINKPSGIKPSGGYASDNKLSSDYYSSGSHSFSEDASINNPFTESSSNISPSKGKLLNNETSLGNSSDKAHPAKGLSNRRSLSRIIDINTADTNTLIALPGIGSKLAGRIVHFREKLGGFYTVEQIREVYGLADSTFQKIRSFLNMGTAVLRKIDINRADMETLRQHPYIKWNSARALVQYRDQHGPFKSVEELQQVVAIHPEVYRKVLPYLIVGNE